MIDAIHSFCRNPFVTERACYRTRFEGPHEKLTERSRLRGQDRFIEKIAAVSP